MNLMELGAIGELVGGIGSAVGGIAVIGSLIYVGLQVRQHSRSVRAGTFSGTTESFNRFNLALATDATLGAIVQRGRADRGQLDERARFQFDYFQLGIFRIIETLFYQTGQGAAEAELWASIRETLEFEIGQPGVRDWWSTNPHRFTGRFTGYVEHLIAPSPD